MIRDTLLSPSLYESAEHQAMDPTEKTAPPWGSRNRRYRPGRADSSCRPALVIGRENLLDDMLIGVGEPRCGGQINACDGVPRATSARSIS